MTRTEKIANEVYERHFTPGPWEVIAGDDYYVNADAYPDQFQGRFKGDDTGAWLALVGNRPNDQGEGNARLIAAAPEMYEALKFIADREDYTFAECSLAEEIVGRAKQALAKAEGRQP